VRRIRNYFISRESFEDMCSAGRFNPCLEITFRDKRGIHHHKLSAGYSDDIYVYREHQETFILTHNPGLGYVGLEVFESDTKSGDIFLEAHQVIEVLGRYELAPFTIVRRLIDFL
jgi:hypothetical protein